MTRALAQRAIGLGAIALLAVLLALALHPLRADANDEDQIGVVGEWRSTVAGTYRLDPETRQTACGYPASDRTLGIAHPVLPCGAKIVIAYDDHEVLTEVVDRGTALPGREFDLTAPLAARLGFRGVQPIRWAYASG